MLSKIVVVTGATLLVYLQLKCNLNFEMKTYTTYSYLIQWESIASVLKHVLLAVKKY